MTGTAHAADFALGGAHHALKTAVLAEDTTTMRLAPDQVRRQPHRHRPPRRAAAARPRPR
jgi:hypothetical protein